MIRRRLLSVLFAGLVATPLSLIQSAGLAETTGTPVLPISGQPGVEVLTRGAVHEAYAEPVPAQPEAAPTVPQQPPASIEEMPAEQRPEGNNSQWIPGYWSWDDERKTYIWTSGFWRVPPPGMQWVPGHWNQVASGWQWTPGLWTPQQQTEIAYLPQPPAPVESAPAGPAPGPDSVYVPGNWVYLTNRYAWRAGYWMGPRPGWVWVPAHFVWTPCGYVFVDGYWDYPLRQRGLLFAPVCLDLQICGRPNFCFQPTFVVRDECLFGALFVRPTYRSYYFGDYFGAPYRQAGFTPWVNYRYGNFGYDPLFSYYRWENRNVGGWENGLRGLYNARYNGSAMLPPRTLVQQNTVINNTNINHTIVNNTTVNNITNNRVNTTNQYNHWNNLAMVAPVNNLNRDGIRLQTVAAEARRAEQRAASQLRGVSVQRGQREAQLLAQSPALPAVGRAPRTVHVDLPRPASSVAAPPAPVAPVVRMPENRTPPHPSTRNPSATTPVIANPVSPNARPEPVRRIPDGNVPPSMHRPENPAHPRIPQPTPIARPNQPIVPPVKTPESGAKPIARHERPESLPVRTPESINRPIPPQQAVPAGQLPVNAYKPATPSVPSPATVAPIRNPERAPRASNPPTARPVHEAAKTVTPPPAARPTPPPSAPPPAKPAAPPAARPAPATPPPAAQPTPPAAAKPAAPPPAAAPRPAPQPPPAARPPAASRGPAPVPRSIAPTPPPPNPPAAPPRQAPAAPPPAAKPATPPPPAPPAAARPTPPAAPPQAKPPAAPPQASPKPPPPAASRSPAPAPRGFAPTPPAPAKPPTTTRGSTEKDKKEKR